MKYLRIKNKGALNAKLIPLMGGTTKSGKDTIGEFGTGLKYCLAYFFRNNIDFKLIINNEEIKIDSKKEKISGIDFEIIYIDGDRTSITANMGKDWEPWMIIREIYSNALDEGEAYYQVVDEIKKEIENTTVFYIGLDNDFLKVINNWDKYFIQAKIPMWEDINYKLYPEEGNFRIYKQGILVYEDESINSIFNYDIRNCKLNELREYQGSLSLDCASVLNSINDKKTIEYFLESMHLVEKDRVKGKKVESVVEETFDLEWSSIGFRNDAWREVLDKVKVIDFDSYQKLKEKANFDLREVLILPKNFFKRFTKFYKTVGAVRTIEEIGSFFEIISDTLFQKVKKAREILEQCNYHIHPELSFIFGEFGSKNTLARVDLDEKLIYISSKIENISMFELIAILIEENEHFQTGLHDETRGFQQHFINLYTKSLLDKNKVEI